MQANQTPLPKGGVSAFNDFKHLLPFGRTTTWRKSKNGEFPQGIRLNASMTVWRNDEILAWLENPNDWKGA